MKMKQLFLIFILVIFPTFISDESSNVDTPLVKLDQLSDEALHMANLGRFNDSSRLLQYFADQLSLTIGSEKLLTMDELKIITESYEEALNAALNDDLNNVDKINKIMKFRLVVDSVVSNYEPLWVGLEGQILTAFYDVKEAVLTGEADMFDTHLNNFLSLYEVLQPSIKIGVPHDVFQQLNMKIVYLDEYRPQFLKSGAVEQDLDMIEADLKSIFNITSEDEADPSLWWVIISTGSIILITLSYVGWRKYIGDREKKKSRSNRLND